MIKKSLILMIFFSVGAAIAAPTEIEERIKYTQTLNPIISSLMSWYGSKIQKDSRHTEFLNSLSNSNKAPHYPKNITQLKILKTEIIKLNPLIKNKLRITSELNYENDSVLMSKIITEIFTFVTSSKTSASIKQITRVNEEQSLPKNIEKFNPYYYKTRELAYAWLAYLDGINTKSVIDLKDAKYTLKIGSRLIEGSVKNVLKKRNEYLYRGGHLLRNIKIQTNEADNKMQELDLIIEWKGINKSGKSVLAKIHQIIEIEIQSDSSWKIISIKEEHLLPDLAPWIGLLC